MFMQDSSRMQAGNKHPVKEGLVCQQINVFNEYYLGKVISACTNDFR
jgi:hypothetical protein